MSTVTIRIRPDGTVEAVTRGIEGPRCLEHIPVIERVTGAQTVDSHFTEDFYRRGVQETGSEQAPVRQWEQR